MNIIEKLQMGGSYTSYISGDNSWFNFNMNNDIAQYLKDSPLLIIVTFLIVISIKRLIKNFADKKVVEARKTEEYWLNSSHQSFKKKILGLYDDLGYETANLLGSREGIVLKNEDSKSILYCFTYEKDFAEEDVEKLIKIATRNSIPEVSVFLSADINSKEQTLLKKRKIKILRLSDILALAETL